jgi:hypothetical protein
VFARPARVFSLCSGVIELFFSIRFMGTGEFFLGIYRHRRKEFGSKPLQKVAGRPIPSPVPLLKLRTVAIRPLPAYAECVQTAFKEWAVVVDALGHGQQIVILRKGGIHEDPSQFVVESPRFLLFPTLFHQQADSIIPSAASRFREVLPLYQEANTIRIEFAAEVVASAKLGALADAELLRGQHIWKDEVIASRFDWGGEKSIFALACRISRLPVPIQLSNSPAYKGCKSWITLEQDIDLSAAQPVLDDAAFAARLNAFNSALGLIQAVP